ncbi:ATP-binding protein [Mucilaginibacter sp. HMF5004]|uniref:ATP-binding protein n=1 Tax=Mucilaginibacter rivuli TaxID=2857527 RepID=UPI001C5DA4CF|nr:ATP-binding protein [Mucilaginibacter rivuli]MBW4891731.1 ATP-binding protein [Mucilaginibacter rivuli]
MKNSLGNPARGDGFYDRSKEIKKIYRVLETGASIYLAAPRRVGKTSILKHLEEFPQEGYHFIYVITESVDDPNEFFKVIFEEVIKSDVIKKIEQLSSAITSAIAGLMGIVKKVGPVELREKEDVNYYDAFVELLSHIKKEHGQVIIMIDEFPQTIQNIFDKHDKITAANFILKNRELRHNKHALDKVSFIYTGSVSLFPMIQKVIELTSINDVRTVDVHPLDYDDAKDFISKLMDNEEFTLDNDMIDYVLERVKWLIPFHLQLIQQEIVDVYESTNNPIDKAAIDQAYDQIVHSRNKPQFEPYFSRLTKIFKDSEYGFVLEVLTYVANNDVIDNMVLSDKSVKHNIEDTKNILDILEGDGYLFKQDDAYRYTSPILQSWCKKHICK